jgi:hypothetical protein
MQAIPSNRLTDPAAAAIARAILARAAEAEVLDSWSSKALLAAYGVPVSRERLVQSRAAAIEAAVEEVGFPCALELGEIRLSGLQDAAAVAAAYDEIGRPPSFTGAWLREIVAGGMSVRIRGQVDLGGTLRFAGDQADAAPALAPLLARIAELARDLADAIAVIELDPVILLPDRIVALGASITPRRGNP